MLRESALQSAFSWSAFSQADALKKRIWFTLGALIVCRIGAYIPLAGVNPEVMLDITRRHAGGFLGMLDMFSGGALGRMTVMTLSLMPYISASIIVQLMTAIFPHFMALKKEGESGRKILNQYTRYLTVLLAAFQAYGIAVGLEHVSSDVGPLVLSPGFFFRMSTAITFVGATLFLMWIGEQISARGIGNGTSMIIYSGIVANLPQSALKTLELGRTGAVSVAVLFLIVAIIVAVIAFIVFMERAHRKVMVQYPKRQVGQRVSQGETSYLPIKLNSAGVIPPIFASSLLLFPATIADFLSLSSGGWLAGIASYLRHGSLPFILLYSGMIIFFAFFYTSIVFNPEETAENLRKSHGFIPGYRPGEATARYFDYLLTRLTVLGSLYLAFVCILPELLMSQIMLSFYLSGTSLLILVSVTMETVSQIQTHLISYQYEGLLKKKRGRRV
jgi:preprotein translocase subunit SecY